MVAWRYEIYLLVLKNSSRVSAANEKINFVSPRGHVISSIYLIAQGRNDEGWLSRTFLKTLSYFSNCRLSFVLRMHVFEITIFREETISVIAGFQFMRVRPLSWSNWNWEILVFVENGKTWEKKTLLIYNLKGRLRHLILILSWYFLADV